MAKKRRKTRQSLERQDRDIEYVTGGRKSVDDSDKSRKGPRHSSSDNDKARPDSDDDVEGGDD